MEEARAASVRLKDPEDGEALHDFRVALRRLRSWLGSFRPQLDDTLRGRYRRQLREVVAQTGEARDLEVMRALVQEEAKGLPPRHRRAAEWLLERVAPGGGEKRSAGPGGGRVRAALAAPSRGVEGVPARGGGRPGGALRGRGGGGNRGPASGPSRGPGRGARAGRRGAGAPGSHRGEAAALSARTLTRGGARGRGGGPFHEGAPGRPGRAPRPARSRRAAPGRDGGGGGRGSAGDAPGAARGGGGKGAGGGAPEPSPRPVGPGPAESAPGGTPFTHPSAWIGCRVAKGCKSSAARWRKCSRRSGSRKRGAKAERGRKAGPAQEGRERSLRLRARGAGRH